MTPPAGAEVLWVEETIRFGDTDRLGHVNNAVYATYAESGRVALFEARLTPTLPGGLFFVIVRLTLDFRAELHWPGRVAVGTWVEAVGRSSLRLAFLVREGERVVASGEAVCVLMDAATRRAAPLPEATRAAALALRGPEAPGHATPPG